MARVKSFAIDAVTKDRRSTDIKDSRSIPWGVPDKAIADFITACEIEHYVTVTTQYIPLPSPRVLIIVTKLDAKDSDEYLTVPISPGTGYGDGK